MPAGQPIKPIFSGECGRGSTPHFGFHAPLWAGLMAAQSGAAQQWYGDQLEAENAYKLFRAARDFVLSAGIADQNTLTKSAPRVACPQNASLVFSPGAYWQAPAQTVFTVGDVAPDGIGDLPRYLQGYYHREWGSNYSFLVNYPPDGGVFSAQITQVAAAGAGLTITVDGVTANSISFAGTGSDQNTNLTLTASVASGSTRYRLINHGLDWLVIGDITLNPYVPMVGAYQIGNSNFAALWFWHRTNIYNATATATVSGTFPLAGLAPGTYAATWWDTFPAGRSATSRSRSWALTRLPWRRRRSCGPPRFTPACPAGQPRRSTARANSRHQFPTAHFAAGDYQYRRPAAVLLTQCDRRHAGPLCGGQLHATGRAGVRLEGHLRRWSGAHHQLHRAGGPKNAKDEGIAGPVNIGFSFPFFSGGQAPGIYTQLYVSPNGFVTFSPFSGDTSVNRALPGTLAPTNLIALLWDDLNLSTSGRIYADTDPIAGTFTLQFQNAPIKGAGSATVTCQLILKTTGEILMQYQSIGVSNACTVGVQNATASQGLQVAYNQTYLQSRMAVRLSPTPWLGLAANAGLVPGSNTDFVSLTFDPASVPAGIYTATLLVHTGDPALPLTVALPVSLRTTPLSPIEQWRLAKFGTTDDAGIAADTADPDHDDLINLFEYAFNTDPKTPNPSPITFDLAGGHLTINFLRTHPAPADITYLFEVAEDVAFGPWQSGPAFTTETVSDNHDGTETVTVSDNTPVPSLAAHYLRIRIEPPLTPPGSWRQREIGGFEQYLGSLGLRRHPRSHSPTHRSHTVYSPYTHRIHPVDNFPDIADGFLRNLLSAMDLGLKRTAEPPGSIQTLSARHLSQRKQRTPTVLQVGPCSALSSEQVLETLRRSFPIHLLVGLLAQLIVPSPACLLVINSAQMHSRRAATT